MTRRRLLLTLGAALAVLVAAGAVWWAGLPRPGITEANGARIKPGMRMKEVEAILGGPPGGYIAGQLVNARPVYRRVGYWYTDDMGILVLFSNDGTVASAECESWRQPTIWERLRLLFP